MNPELIIQILNILLPSFVAVSTVFLTNYFNNLFDKRKIMQQRIDKIYKPFYLEYFKYRTNHLIWEPDDVIKYIAKIHSMCLNHIDCLETSTQGLVIEIASELSVYSPGDFEYYCTIEKDFQNLVETMFKEYSQICSKLKHPKPLTPL